MCRIENEFYFLFLFIIKGTATDDIVGAMEKFSHGESYIADNSGSMRQTIALVSMFIDLSMCY